MKEFFKTLAMAIAVTTAVGTISACAAFEKKTAYTEGQFTDVPASEWYADSVKSAYEFGIMNGNSATTFNPGGTLTVAEGITISARIHATVNKKQFPVLTAASGTRCILTMQWQTVS